MLDSPWRTLLGNYPNLPGEPEQSFQYLEERRKDRDYYSPERERIIHLIDSNFRAVVFSGRSTAAVPFYIAPKTLGLYQISQGFLASERLLFGGTLFSQHIKLFCT